MAKVTIDNLDTEIRKVLQEYGADVKKHTAEVVQIAAQLGAKAVRSASLSKFAPSKKKLKQGRYGTGWTAQADTGRLAMRSYIWNKKYPGLPHLLEHGHAKRNGGRTAGVEHIAPVEAQLDRIVYEELKKLL